VIEVTQSQAIGIAQQKALRWINETSCLEVILISFSAQGQNLCAFVYCSGPAANPVQTVQFGGGHCTALGQVQLQIQLASIFEVAALIPAAVAAANPGRVLNIDLFPIKQAILNAL